MNWRLHLLWFLIFLFGCAGVERGCSSCNAQAYGADWLVVQYRNDGTPISCWKLNGISVANEEHSDGIYWQDSSGNLVHLSGWYNRVQVAPGQWDKAADHMGVDIKKCSSGKYPWIKEKE